MDENDLKSVRDSLDLQNDKIDSIADFLNKEVRKINKSITQLISKLTKKS